MNTFHETQRFNQWWMVLIAFGVTGLMCYALIQQIVFNIPFGDHPASNTGLILIAVFVFILFGTLQFISLRTTIDETGIRIKFHPFWGKEFKWTDIETYEILNYGFVGGWGIRPWTKYGTVYNVKGRIGIAIQLKDGKKYLIGTQKEDELKHFLTRISH